MRPASVVLATVFNGVPFEAVQLFRGMERGLMCFACQSLNESQKTFHLVSLARAVLIGGCRTRPTCG